MTEATHHQLEPSTDEVWQAEEFQFSLQYAGRNAGNLRWVAGVERHHWVIRCETQFAGLLGGARRVQVSKLEPSTRMPVGFAESDGAGGRHFETSFDRKTGLVTLRQGRDEASIALTQDYFDPLSLLQHLRELNDAVTHLRVPMVGGTVLVTRMADETLQMPWGESLSRVYYLRPGLGLVHIESAAPHRILKLGQTFGKFMLEASLVRSGVPSAAPSSHLAAPLNPDRRVGGRREVDGDQQSRQPRRVRSRPALVEATSSAANQATAHGDAPTGKRKRHRRSKRPGEPAPTTALANINPAKEQPEGAAQTARRRRKRFRRRRGNDGSSGGGES